VEKFVGRYYVITIYCTGNLVGVPTTYFLDEYGTIKYIKVGAFDNYQEMDDILKSY